MVSRDRGNPLGGAATVPMSPKRNAWMVIGGVDGWGEVMREYSLDLDMRVK